VRVVVAAMTRMRPFTAAELAPPDRHRWQQQRKAMRERFARRSRVADLLGDAQTLAMVMLQWSPVFQDEETV
jgi:hypothetical protein